MMFASSLFAQTQINPATQVRWPAVTGNGAPPANTCPIVTSGTTTSGSNVVVVTSNSGLFPAQTVTGTGIPTGTTVNGVNGTTVTLSANATASGAASLSFYPYGQPYTDSAGNLHYICGSVGWFQSGGVGGGTVTSVSAPSVSWPSWLVPTVTNPTTAPQLTVAAAYTPANASGTTNNLSKFTSLNALGNSSLTDNGSTPTRAPNGVDTGINGNYQEFTTATGGVVQGQAVCVTATNDGNGRPEVATCSTSSLGAGFAGIAQASVSAGGTVEVCWTVNCPALFDGGTTQLHEAIISTTIAGDLHDTGSATPTPGQANFSILSANAGAGTTALIGITDATSAAGGIPPVLQTNGVNNASQTTLNVQSSSTNASGLSATASNPSLGNVKYEIGVSSQSLALASLGAAPALAACTDESTAFTPANGLCYFVIASVSTATPAASAFVAFRVTTSSAGSFALTGTTIVDGGGCSTYILGTTLTLPASQTVAVWSDGTTIRAVCTTAGGTTTNALTANSTGGAAPGSTFNGSAAAIWDYHTFGAAGVSGTPTTGNCADWASANTLGDAGAPCGTGGFANPMTTLGDLIAGSTGGSPVRLGVGTNGKVLTADSTAPYGFNWESVSGGGTILDNAVWVSPNCNSLPNCYQVYDDAQVAETATYTTTQTGATAMTMATSGSSSLGAEILANASGSPASQSITFGLGTSDSYYVAAAAFKSAGSGGTLGSCWTGSNSGGPSVTVAVTPTGGSGHMLIAFTLGYSAVPTWTDPNNTWTNVNPSILNVGGIAYASNIVGGSYNVTVAYGSSPGFPSALVCEVSGMATSNVLDGAGLSVDSSSSTGVTAVTAPTSNDLIFAAWRTASNHTFSAGTYGGTVAVATTSADPPFSPSDVGKKVVNTTNCDNGNGYIDCHSSQLYGSIASYVDAHDVTVTGYPLLSSASTGKAFTGWFIWGHDDGAQLQAAWNKALTTPGMTLKLACGMMMTSQPPFLSTLAGSPNNPSIEGCSGGSATVIIPSSDYNYAAANAGTFYSYPNTNFTNYPTYGDLFQNPFYFTTISNLAVWGGGQDGSQIGSAFGLPMFNASLARIENVYVIGWDYATNVGSNAMPAVSGNSLTINNYFQWVAGTNGITITGDQLPTAYYNQISNSVIGDGPLVLSAGITASSHNWLAGGVLGNGGMWRSTDDMMQTATLSGGIHAYFDNSTMRATSAGLSIGGSSSATAINSEIDSFTLSSGLFNDLGGNFYCIAIPSYTGCAGGAQGAWTGGGHLSITGGSIYGDASLNLSGVSNSNFALTSGWGSGATVSGATGSDLNGTFKITEAGTPSANPVLTFTFPTRFAVAPNACIIQQVAGNFTLSNPTTPGPSATSVAWTFTGTPVSTDTYTFSFHCGN